METMSVLRPCPRCDGAGTVAMRLEDLGELDRTLLRAVADRTQAGLTPIYSHDLNTIHGPSVRRYRALSRLVELQLLHRSGAGTAVRSQRPPRYRYAITADGLALLKEIHAYD